MIFLGVETSPVPSVLCEQMNLPKGFGLVVDYVVPNGPAATAGVQQNDILKMLNDQILMEPNQLRKLLQSFQDGNTITLTVLRKGQEQKISVKLSKKDVPKRNAMNGNHGFDFNFDFGDLGLEHLGDLEHMGDLKERLQDMKEQVNERVAEQKERLKEQLEQQKDMIRETVKNAQEAAARARDEAQRAANQQMQIHSSTQNGLQTTRIDVGKAQIVLSDDKGEMRLETIDGKRVLTAKDPKGLLLFSGPIDNAEEKAKVPADVRQRLEKLELQDLPSVNAQSADDEDASNSDSDDDGDDDDDDSSATEQVSFSPQDFSRSILPIHTILI